MLKKLVEETPEVVKPKKMTPWDHLPNLTFLKVPFDDKNDEIVKSYEITHINLGFSLL